MNLQTLSGFFRSTCPICYSRDIRFSRRKTTRERLLTALFYIRPFRCRNCWSRFWKLESTKRRQASSAPSKNIAVDIPHSRFSMAAVFDPVILIVSAFSTVFVLMLSEFPTFALYGLITCVIVMLTELQHQSFDWTVAFFALEFGSTLPAHRSLLRVVSHARCFFRG